MPIDAPDLRVLIIARDPLARAGLAVLLEQQPGCVVVGQVDGETGALDAIDIYQPELVLFDLGWDATTAPPQLAALSQADVPVVALLPDDAAAAEVWQAGALGLLLRNSDAGQIGAALPAVRQGLAVIAPELSGALSHAPLPAAPKLLDPLTPREVEVLQLLAEGLPNKAIARRLAISEHTVKFHVNSILSKIGAQSRTEAVVKATQLGLILL